MEGADTNTARCGTACLIAIMAVIALIVLGMTTFTLYQTAFEEERNRLVDTVRSQARLIEAMAHHDLRESGQVILDDVLDQVRDAHRNFPGFGKTGEFTLARREGNQIVFLLNHRHYDLDELQPVPVDGVEAAPMRRALAGESGSLIGPDYRGETVLAAYEPVEELNIGVVAKIDLREIRAPFIQAAWISGAIAFVLVLFGAWTFRRVTAPMTRRIEQSEKLFRETFEHAAIGLAHVATDGGWLRVNDALCEITGYPREELLQLTFQDITHPEDLDADLQRVGQTLAGEVNTYAMEKRYIRKDGSTVPVQITVSLVRDHAGKPDYFIAAVADISPLKQAMATIRTISGILPLCAWCGNAIKDDSGNWIKVDKYIESHTDAKISHGMCPSCRESLNKADAR